MVGFAYIHVPGYGHVAIEVKGDTVFHNAEIMQVDPFDGAIYVFRAKRADRIKLVFWDGTGVCLFSKLLEDGQFRWPKIEDGVMRLSAAQLSALLEGLDWRRVRQAKDTVAPQLPG